MMDRVLGSRGLESVRVIVSEEELTTAALDGDAEALMELLCRYDAAVRNRISGKIPKRHRAAFDDDDVLQVTYMEALLRIGQFTSRGPGAFLAWVARIAENNLRDAIRELERDKRPPRHKQLAPMSDGDSYGTLLGTLGATTTTPSRHAARAEIKDLLDDALDKLPADYQKVVRLHDLEKWPLRKIAADMNRSVGTIHMLKLRAHDRLAELLGESTDFFSK